MISSLGVSWNARQSLISVGQVDGPERGGITDQQTGYLPQPLRTRLYFFGHCEEGVGWQACCHRAFRQLVFNGFACDDTRDRLDKMLALGFSLTLVCPHFHKHWMTLGIAPVTGLHFHSSY